MQPEQAFQLLTLPPEIIRLCLNNLRMDQHMVLYYNLCLSRRNLRNLINRNAGRTRISPSFVLLQAGDWNNDEYFVSLFQVIQVIQTGLRHVVGLQCHSQHGHVIYRNDHPAQVSSDNGATLYDLTHEGFHVFERTLSPAQRALLRRRIHQLRLGIPLD